MSERLVAGLQGIAFYAGLVSVFLFWVVAAVWSIPGGIDAASYLGLPEPAGAAFAILGILMVTILSHKALDAIEYVGGVER